MSKFSVSLSLILGALVMAPATAQTTDKAPSSTPIAGKATATKAAPTKATTERKKYEFTAAKAAAPGAAAATLAPTDGTAHSSMPAAGKDKAGCHSRGSDA